MKTRSLLVGLLGFACGGTDEPPLCPTGDCTLPSSTVIRWTLNSYPELLFQGDTCNDLSVKMMRVDIVGIDDPTYVETKDVECNQSQASFLGLPVGSYTATLTALDGAGEPMVNAPTTATVMAGMGGMPSTTTVNLPFEQWKLQYTGTLLFRLSWAGASCETAVPNVATQTLTLMVGGTMVATAMTDMGQKLDGMDPKPCRVLGESFAQFAEGIASGPATFAVVGRDVNDAIAFEKTFDTFIGAAKNNPTIMFDVPAPPPPDPPDAGVDAPSD